MAEQPQAQKPGQTQGSQAKASRGEEQVPITRKAPESGARLEQKGRSGGLGLYPGATPFAMMRRMMEDMDRMFENFGMGSLMPSMLPAIGMPGQSMLGAGRIWSPEIEVSERDGRMVVSADLPGLKKDDIEIELQEDQLVLRGQRREQRDEQRGDVSYSERSYGSFVRTMALPPGVQPDQVDASFDNGVLEISIALPQQSRRRIDIRTSGAEQKLPSGGAQEPAAPGGAQAPGATGKGSLAH